MICLAIVIIGGVERVQVPNGLKEGLMLLERIAESLDVRNLCSLPVLFSYQSSNSPIPSFQGTATQYILGHTFGFLSTRVSQGLLSLETNFGRS